MQLPIPSIMEYLSNFYPSPYSFSINFFFFFATRYRDVYRVIIIEDKRSKNDFRSNCPRIVERQIVFRLSFID